MNFTTHTQHKNYFSGKILSTYDIKKDPKKNNYKKKEKPQKEIDQSKLNEAIRPSESLIDIFA